jgi:hypothetical protein
LEAFSALSKRMIQPGSVIYDISRSRMHLRGIQKKPQCDLTAMPRPVRDSRSGAGVARPARSVGQPDRHPRGPDIILENRKIIVLV